MRTLMISAMVFALLGIGCGDDDGAGTGGGGSGGTGGAGTGGMSGSGGVGGSTTEMCGDNDAGVDDPNCINPLCPQESPTTGAFAPKGECCFRSSNADRARAAWDNDELATLEFRQNALTTYSQPTTVGLDLIQASLVNTYASDWSNTMVRIAGVPETGSGPVKVTVGSGRYNCNGTYSFFGDNAAPDHEGRTDKARWEAPEMDGMWDWDSEDKLILPVANRAPGVHWGPVAKSDGEFGYEQPSVDLYYSISFGAGTDLDPEQLNCIGGRLAAANEWEAALEQITFFPVEDLKGAFVDSAALQQNFCSFMALGYMVPESCDDVDQADWIEKPAGMCDDEHCYVGDADHDLADCGDAEKPCCDPSATDDTMPACNAFVIQARSVLAGAEITDAPFNDSEQPFADCNQ